MGIDAEILFEAKGDISDLRLGEDFEVREVRDFFKDDHKGVTHEAYTCVRYYGEWYERGPWPLICGVLMKLHAHPNVGKVWYGGDSSHTVPECTPMDVVETSLHYMFNGNRPYTDRVAHDDSYKKLIERGTDNGMD